MATTNCETCRQTYKKYKQNGFDNVEPPCSSCFPGTHEYNEDILEIFGYVNGQYISDYNHTLNAIVVFDVLDRLGVDKTEQLNILKDLQYFNNIYVNEIKNKNKSKNGKN
jgi:protein-arginine kinase activator protein McsA